MMSAIKCNKFGIKSEISLWSLLKFRYQLKSIELCNDVYLNLTWMSIEMSLRILLKYRYDDY